jgi:hypothetical protein
MATRLTTPKARKPRQRGLALYLYGVTQNVDAARPFAVRSEGVDGAATVEALPCAGLLCWVSRVPAVEFGRRLPEKMQDLDWLAAAGIRHQRVVGEIAATTEVLPTRFGTVFLSEESLLADVRRRKRALAAVFKKIAGCDEWGVKVFALPQPVKTPSKIRSGRDYLAHKAALRPPPRKKGADPELQKFASELAKLAVDAAPGGAVSSGRPNLVWHTSLLIRRSARPRLERVLARFAERWSGSQRIECTGPWPPYSFVAPHAR